jgi:glycosyltransferase involved in cell wall biosynthesis
MSETEGPILTVAAVNCDAPDWIRLFVQSVRKFTADVPHEILVVDNGSLDVNLTWLRAQTDVRLLELPTIELYHGGGMNIATQAARGKYVCIMDSDAHFQSPGWATDLIALYHADPKTRLVGVVGPGHKPLHPPLFFFERAFAAGCGIDWRYRPDPDVPTQTDTAQQVYWDVLELGYNVVRLPKGPKVYQSTSWYDQLWIGNPARPFCAHFWSGSRFQEANPKRTKQILDGVSLADHLARKAAFMAEPEVMSILEEGGGNG